jgi:hypothetical protein
MRGDACHCKWCDKPFEPSKFSGGRQKYCGERVCRKASKKESQAKWCAKNPNYFRDDIFRERSRLWRATHPEVARTRFANPMPEPAAKAESCTQNSAAESGVQDSAQRSQQIYIMGLISLVTGSSVQDEVLKSAQECFRRGMDIFRHDVGKTAQPVMAYFDG